MKERIKKIYKFPNSFWYNGLQFNHVNEYLSEKYRIVTAHLYYNVNYFYPQPDPKKAFNKCLSYANGINVLTTDLWNYDNYVAFESQKINIKRAKSILKYIRYILFWSRSRYVICVSVCRNDNHKTISSVYFVFDFSQKYS